MTTAPSRVRRLFVWLLLSLMLLLASGFVALRAVLLASRARTQGDLVMAGLSAPVDVSRDRLGVVTLHGETLEDVARATGFIHAQERFFQMDLSRRFAAGELSEIIGVRALPTDRRMRAHRFRAESTEVLRRLPDAHQRLLHAYSEGVNAGLADLGARPPEYYLLGARPAPWTPEDSLLAMFSMFEALSTDGRTEDRLAVMHAALPAQLVEFLTPDSSRFDAPILIAGAERGANDYTPAPIPGPEIIDLRTASGTLPSGAVAEPPGAPLGSNNWVVAASRSATGGAILANDMHLQLSVPGTWFRAQLEWGGHRAEGVTLPGVPGIVVGSNGRIAWGFTNTTGDFQDNVVVEVDAADKKRYRTPEGSEAFGEIVETIKVNGAEPDELRLHTTRWGIVTGDDFAGRPLVLKWTALDAEHVNLGLFDMLGAETVEQGVDIARRWYGPSQNVMVADSAGRIGWVVSGYLPKRMGFDGKFPVSWAAPGVGWAGALDESRRPLIINPQDGALYSANNRTANLPESRLYGNCWGLAARAQRIADRLRSKDRLNELDMLNIQLDTRASLFDLYRDLIIECSTDEDPDASLRRAHRLAAAWNGTADLDQRAFALLVAFRIALHDRLVTPLVAGCRKLDPKFTYRWLLAEEPVRRILEGRPPHLLPRGDANWRSLLRGALTDAIAAMEKREPRLTIDATWGEVNRVSIKHPLASGAAFLGPLLNMAGAGLPGHWSCVRVTTSAFGASERMVVSPGHEDRAIFHMPAGQSGHFLSDHYSDGHSAWMNGEATGLMAGQRVSGFALRPRP